METKKETILVVDDTPSNLSVLFAFLERADYEVLVVGNGQAALESVKRRPPDLILLDIMMPVMDGYETCDRLKADPVTKDIPVIFMTALNDVVDEVKGFAQGAVDYITKPVRMERVLARIKTHLALRRLQQELQQKNAQLEEALANVKTLSGYLPICANCKKIRDDEGYWQQVEVYVRSRTDVQFSHGICPDCMTLLYPDFRPSSK
ncbi:MAG TPA: response regulator [Anaerolineae bacterium]|nr:response regulator [Anaerolineae bacterium]HMR64268.1 response regulator [Anaerolineae bacterium]